MICRLGLRARISGFKLEVGFEVGAPLVDLDDEAQLPLPGEGKKKKITKDKRPGFLQDSFTEGFFSGWLLLDKIFKLVLFWNAGLGVFL